MPTGYSRSTINVGGMSFVSTVSRDGEGQISHQVSLAAGKAGAISASGVDGLPTGHGFVQNDIIDVHWVDADGVPKCRYGITVDSAATNAITFDDTPNAAGDALPAEDWAVVVSLQTLIDTDFDGDNVALIAAMSSKQARICFEKEAGTVIKSVNVPANEAWMWASNQGVANPLTGDPVGKIIVSNGSASAATVVVGLVYSSVA